MHKSYCTNCDEVQSYKVDATGGWECRACGYSIECVECGGTMSARHDCDHAHGREPVDYSGMPDLRGGPRWVRPAGMVGR